MSCPRRIRPSLALAALLAPCPAVAQDLPDTQVLTNRVLFAKEDLAARQRAAEQRRVDDLDRRAQQQAVLLEEQAQSVRLLGGQLRRLRDERELIEQADAFDAALAAGRPAAARALLAETVTVGLEGAAAAPVPADALVQQLAALVARSGLLPRSNQRVSFDGDGAVLTADGYSWGGTGRSREALDARFGRYEYRYARTAQGWRITGIAFRPTAPL